VELNGYFLHGVDGEKLLVVRGYNEPLLEKIILTLKRSRDQDIKELAEVLENHFNERHDDGRSSVETRSKNKKNGRKRI
jgi:hypothetical protein